MTRSRSLKPHTLLVSTLFASCGGAGGNTDALDAAPGARGDAGVISASPDAAADAGGGPGGEMTAPDAATPADAAPPPAPMCRLWDTPLLANRPDAPPADCASLGGAEKFACAEAWVWATLQDRLDARPQAHDILSAVIDAADPATEANELARMLAYRGQLGLAVTLENDDPRFVAEVVPDFERAAELAPENLNLPLWKDTMDIAFAALGGGRAGLVAAAERAFDHVEAGAGGCAYVNTITLAGTTIGLPMDTGIPERTVELLGTQVCSDLSFCTANTWRAPYARPGLAYQLGEAYARVGDAEQARVHFSAALSEPGADTWAYRDMARDTLDNLDAVIAEYQAVPPDRGVFDSVSGNSRFGCILCHSPTPPDALVEHTRLHIVADPAGEEPPPPPPPPPPDLGLPGDPVTGDALDALVGDYATFAVTGTIVTTPIGEQPSRIVSLGWVHVARDGALLRATEHGCHVEGEPAPGFTMRLEDAVPRSVEPVDSLLGVTREADGTWHLGRPQVAVAVGWSPDTDASEALPQTAQDPRVIDADGNGEPGISMTMSGPLGDVRLDVVQRSCGLWTAALPAGPVSDFTASQDTACTTQHTLAATNPLFAGDAAQRPAPDPALHTLRFVRLAGPADCGRVLADRAALFGAN